MRFHDPPEKMYLLTAVMLIEATQYAKMDALELLIRLAEAGFGEGLILLTAMASAVCKSIARSFHKSRRVTKDTRTSLIQFVEKRELVFYLTM